jgi:8-oxo-dGTP diphosphatase
VKEPRYFYVVGDLGNPDFAKSLIRGYFEGLTGVSDTPEILNEFLWLKGAALAMPTDDLLAINEYPLLCSVAYDDADTLAADNLKTFGRLFNNAEQNEGNFQQRILKLRTYITEALQLYSQQAEYSYPPNNELASQAGYLSRSLAHGGIPSSEIAEKMAAHEGYIDSVGDLAAVLWDTGFMRTYRGYTSARATLSDRFDPVVFTLTDMEKVVRRALEIAASIYSNEGEWIVQQDRMNIPESSILILTFESGIDYPRTWFYKGSDGEHLREWEREKARFYEGLGMEPGREYTYGEFLDRAGLREQYDTRVVDYKSLMRSRDSAKRQAKRRAHLEGVRNRYINPSPRNEAAGIYLVAEDTGRFLFVRRAGFVNEPRTWAGVGGAVEPGEGPLQAARREVAEEIGYTGPMRIYPVRSYEDDRLVYHNHVALVPSEFVPALNEENTDYRWASPSRLPRPLHPGVEWSLRNDDLFTAWLED